MKYCVRCGNELYDEAVMCPNCGHMVDEPVRKNMERKRDDERVSSNGSTDYKKLAKIFMIIGTVLSAAGYLIPLAWTIPMTVIYCKRIKEGKPISMGFKICSLLFVSLLGGIFMILDKD